MIDLTIFGLAIIFIGWIIQFFKMNKRREISSAFIIMYIIGVLFLIVSAFTAKQIDIAILNLLTGIAAICVLIKFSKPRI